jgi:dihydrofolate reductase/thymidylate synthase
MFNAIVAVDSKNGIAKDGIIPWYCPNDMRHFKFTTLNSAVIMGRKTWESLPNKLPDRINTVISNSKHITGSPDIVFESIDKCVEYFATNYKDKKKFVIGGKSIYEQFIKRNLIWKFYVTEIQQDYKCDLFINIDYSAMKCLSLQHYDGIYFRKYYLQNNEEIEMLSLMDEILTTGNKRKDRTDTGTLSLFSRELRFDLSQDRIPMMTTRPLSLRIIFEELMWILRGQTDNKILNEKKINIWNDNTSREFLDKRELHYLPEGDIGASYGFQMRHYGDTYINCKTENKGFDQLDYVINLLKTDPYNRRIIINLWNPTQLDQMALPPCLYGYQFYVAEDSNKVKRLSCKLIQRSSDIALAGSHNCSAGALLVRMLCNITGLEPGELIWSPSDIHIYLNQVKSVEQQLKRIPKPYPILKIVKNPVDNDIRNFEFGHLMLLNYDPHPRIHFAMNA